MFEYKVLADHDKRQEISRAISMATRARRSATDVDRRELVVSASCQASSDRMRRRRNIIPSPGPSSDRRPMRAKPLTARIVVMNSSHFLNSQSPAIESRGLGKSFGSRAALEGRRSRGRARRGSGGPLQKESHMLSSDFLRGLRFRLVTAILFLARHARHFENASG